MSFKDISFCFLLYFDFCGVYITSLLRCKAYNAISSDGWGGGNCTFQGVKQENCEIQKDRSKTYHLRLYLEVYLFP